jgi:hypothetical protein
VQKLRKKAATKRLFKRALPVCLDWVTQDRRRLRSYPAARATIPELAIGKLAFLKARADLNFQLIGALNRIGNESTTCTASYHLKYASMPSAPGDKVSLHRIRLKPVCFLSKLAFSVLLNCL